MSRPTTSCATSRRSRAIKGIAAAVLLILEPGAGGNSVQVPLLPGRLSQDNAREAAPELATVELLTMPEPIIRLTRSNGTPLLCVLSHFDSVQTSNGETMVRMVAQHGELMNIQVRETEGEVQRRVDAAKAKAG